MIFRLSMFVVLLGLSAVVPTPLYAIAAIAYALRYTAYELIIIGVLVDAFYGSSTHLLIPYYTMATCIGLILMEWIKPRISLYNQ